MSDDIITPRGPYRVMRPGKYETGWLANEMIKSWAGETRASPAVEACPYCGTYHNLPRCQSCGAPQQTRTLKPL